MHYALLRDNQVAVPTFVGLRGLGDTYTPPAAIAVVWSANVTSLPDATALQSALVSSGLFGNVLVSGSGNTLKVSANSAIDVDSSAALIQQSVSALTTITGAVQYGLAPKNVENILDKVLDFVGVDPSKLNTGDWIVPIGIGLGVLGLIIVLKTVKK